MGDESGTCYICSNPGTALCFIPMGPTYYSLGRYCCIDCMWGSILCGGCIVNQHLLNPFHRIQVHQYLGISTPLTRCRNGQVHSSRRIPCKTLDKGYNSVIPLVTLARAHKEAPVYSPCFTRMEYIKSTFGFVAVTSLLSMAIVSSNSSGVVCFLLQQRTHKPHRVSPFSSLPTFSVSNRSYRSTISTYLLRFSPTQHVSLVSRYVFGVVVLQFPFLSNYYCQNHSADDTVRARAKGPCLRGRTETAFTPYKRKGERGGTRLTRQRASK